MAKVKFKLSDTKAPPVRRKVSEVLGIDDAGASAVGSTYNKKGMSCWREFGLSEDAGLFPTAVREPLDRGSLWHTILEHYYGELYIDPKNFDKAGRAGFAIIKDLEHEPGFREEFDKLSMMFEVYLDAYQDRWKILAVEEELVDHRLPYSARLDLLVNESGLWDVEHKTTRAITKDLLASYQLDIQILGQHYLIDNVLDPDEYGELKGIIVNIITTGNKVPRVERVRVNPSRYHIEAFKRCVEDQHGMRAAAKKLGWPQSLGKCSGYARGYGKCQFYDLCDAHPTTSVQDWIEQEDPPLGFARKDR